MRDFELRLEELERSMKQSMGDLMKTLKKHESTDRIRSRTVTRLGGSKNSLRDIEE